MPEMRKVVAALPSGKFFEQVFDAINAVCGEASLSRVDVEFSSDQRLGAACSAIESADLVLIDISARNPNTMYLAGYSHGIGKRVLLLALHGEDFPFDKTRHETVIYAGNLDLLKTEVAGRINGAQPQAAPQSDARARFQEFFGEILKRHSHEHRGDIQMENEKTFVLLNQDMDLALVQDLARKGRELGVRVKLM